MRMNLPPEWVEKDSEQKGGFRAFDVSKIQARLKTDEGLNELRQANNLHSGLENLMVCLLIEELKTFRRLAGYTDE